MNEPFGRAALEVGAAIELEDQVLYYAPWVKKYGLVVWRTDMVKMWLGTKPDERGRYAVLPVAFGYGYKDEDFVFTKMREKLIEKAERDRLAA